MGFMREIKTTWALKMNDRMVLKLKDLNRRLENAVMDIDEETYLIQQADCLTYAERDRLIGLMQERMALLESLIEVQAKLMDFKSFL